VNRQKELNIPNKKPIFILLGTYNGETYLSEQIESVREQTWQNWKLFIRDDGSDDGTNRLLNTYQQKDSRIQRVVDNKGNLGTIGNYNELCRIALKNDADTIFFCDQDDVWLPDKVETHVQAIQDIESQNATDCPILVHSDLSVVDSHLKHIHKSFLAYHGVRNVYKEPLCTLLAQNYITACASAFNRALLKLATPIPEEALMHDWWMALCAAACGQIGFIEKPLTFYRQHSDNTIGAKGLLNSINPFRNNLVVRWQDGHKHFIQSVHQGGSTQKRIKEQKLSVHPSVMKCIDTYANCLKLGRFKRTKAMHKSGIRRQGIMYQTLFYILLLFSRGVLNK